MLEIIFANVRDSFKYMPQMVKNWKQSKFTIIKLIYTKVYKEEDTQAIKTLSKKKKI